MDIRKAKMTDLPDLTALAQKLWSGHEPAELQEELGYILAREEAAFYLAVTEEVPVGFAQCQLRHDYVEGTEGSPVGYLEGIYVEAAFRHRGVAKALLAACEVWARAQGCREFASDCELENTDSLRFHLNVGFAEANRIICFAKKL